MNKKIVSERIKKEEKIFKEYLSLMRVGSSKSAVYKFLGEKYGKHPTTILMIVKRWSNQDGQL